MKRTPKRRLEPAPRLCCVRASPFCGRGVAHCDLSAARARGQREVRGEGMSHRLVAAAGSRAVAWPLVVLWRCGGSPGSGGVAWTGRRALGPAWQVSGRHYPAYRAAGRGLRPVPWWRYTSAPVAAGAATPWSLPRL
jgi:hypothetical protein